MAYTASESGTVTISAAGSASGTVSVTVYDNSTRPPARVDSCSIPTSGTVGPSVTDKSVGSGQSTAGNTWTVSVSRSGSNATGTAAGSYSGTSLNPSVPVTVDHGGKAHHGHRSAGA